MNTASASDISLLPLCLTFHPASDALDKALLFDQDHPFVSNDSSNGRKNKRCRHLFMNENHHVDDAVVDDYDCSASSFNMKDLIEVTNSSNNASNDHGVYYDQGDNIKVDLAFPAIQWTFGNDHDNHDCSFVKDNDSSKALLLLEPIAKRHCRGLSRSKHVWSDLSFLGSHPNRSIILC